MCHEIGHRLRAQDHAVASRPDAAAADSGNGGPGRLRARRAGEILEARPGGPPAPLGLQAFHHGGEKGKDARRFVGLDLRNPRRSDGDPFLSYGDIPTHYEAQGGDLPLARGPLR